MVIVIGARDQLYYDVFTAEDPNVKNDNDDDHQAAFPVGGKEQMVVYIGCCMDQASKLGSGSGEKEIVRYLAYSITRSIRIAIRSYGAFPLSG